MTNIGLIGTKIGMSREFFPIGISVPVTVIKIEKGRVIDLITKDKRGMMLLRWGLEKLKHLNWLSLWRVFTVKNLQNPENI